jgi:tRNA (guanine37-N1)-methyltransferase
MRFDVITIFPEMFAAFSESGITRRALDLGLIELKLWNPRDFTSDKHRTVDDRPYGGGPGMVMLYAPLKAAIDAAHADDARVAPVVYLSPQGAQLKQRMVSAMQPLSRVILLAGRYEGIDERLIQSEVDFELSIGDYVLSGGELPAMVLMDALTRQIPGALGDAQSAEQDSFADGLLDCPHYTRPEEIAGQRIPEVLQSGNHAEIARWRAAEALARTQARRPDLLEASSTVGPAETDFLRRLGGYLP